MIDIKIKEKVDCMKCFGKGKIKISYTILFSTYNRMVICHNCNGKGFI